jgi:hypothetical protein
MKKGDKRKDLVKWAVIGLLILTFLCILFKLLFPGQVTTSTGNSINGNVVPSGYIDGCTVLPSKILFAIQELNEQGFHLIPKEGDVSHAGDYFIYVAPYSKEAFLFRIKSTINASGIINDQIPMVDFLTGITYNTTFNTEGHGYVTISGEQMYVTFSGDSYNSSAERSVFVTYSSPRSSKLSFENCLNPSSAVNYPSSPALNFDSINITYAVKFTANPVNVQSDSWIAQIAGGIDKPVNVTYAVVNFLDGAETVFSDEFIKISNPANDSISERLLKYIGTPSIGDYNYEASHYFGFEKGTFFWSGKKIESNNIIRNYSLPMKGIYFNKIMNATIEGDNLAYSLGGVSLNEKYISGDYSEIQIKNMMNSSASQKEYRADMDSLIQIGDPSSVGFYNL